MAIAQERAVSTADIPTGLAMRLGRFNGFGDLLEAALNSRIPLRTELLPHEKAQSDRFVEIMLSPISTRTDLDDDR